MTGLTLQIFEPVCLNRLARRGALILLALLVAAVVAHARSENPVPVNIQSTASIHFNNSSDDTAAPLVIDGANDADVFGLGRSIVVRGDVKKGAIAFGGDVFVEGRVEGDVAAIGGSVFQREGSYIGGDVMVIGGAYHHGKAAPERNPASTTVMFAGYETELRRMMRVREVLCDGEDCADELYRLLLFYRDRALGTTADPAEEAGGATNLRRLLVVGKNSAGIGLSEARVSEVVNETLGANMHTLDAKTIGLALPQSELSFDEIAAPAGIATLAWQ